MRYMSKIIYDAPDALRTRLGRNLPDAARAWDAEKDRVLGVQGTPARRSRAGEAPRRQTGKLMAGTRAVPAASRLEIQIVTTSVGKILDGRLRPFVHRITRASADARRAALYRK